MDHHGSGIGVALRHHRERQGLSLDSLSRMTMIRRDYLELIDTDHLERLPSGAYAKGFIRAYATCMGLDPQPYVQAYDSRCGGPAPRLSARHPVRVPHAVQPRTWRMAAGAGVAILVLLGAIGMLRPGDHTAEPPTPPAADMVALAGGVLTREDAELQEARAALGTIVRVEVIGDQAWVEGEPDGTREFAGTLRRGERKVFRGTQTVNLVIGNAEAVRMYVNGRDLGTPPGSTYRATMTPDTTELPPHSPAPASSED